MIRLARIVTDPKYRGPLNRDLIRDGLTFESLGWQGLADYIDYPPEGTSLREAVDGALTLSAIHAAQIVHAIAVLNWNYRNRGLEQHQVEPYPQLDLPGIEQQADGKRSWGDMTDGDIAEMFRASN